MVGATHAVFPRHLYLRRVPEVHSASQPGGLGGIGDLLLALWQHVRCACCPRVTTRPHLNIHHAALLLFPYSNNLRSIYHFHQVNGLADATGGTTVVWLCYVIITDWHGSSPSGITTVILASFYLHNDFACSSNNKYLCRTIPVR